jgi:hypothetical protein
MAQLSRPFSNPRLIQDYCRAGPTGKAVATAGMAGLPGQALDPMAIPLGYWQEKPSGAWRQQQIIGPTVPCKGLIGT